MALTRQKSKPFTFTRTPNTPDAQYFRRELESVLDFIEQQFNALAVGETAATDIIPTARGGFGLNISAIPQFGVPYATQPGKFGWQNSSAFSIGLLGRQSQAEWQTALGITSFGSMPPNTLLGRYDAAPGPTQVAGVGAGLLYDAGNLRVTDALLALSALTANDGDVMRYDSGNWVGQTLGNFWDDLMDDPQPGTYSYPSLPFTVVGTPRLLGRSQALNFRAAEISLGDSLSMIAESDLLDTIQDIRISATPQFAQLGLGGAAVGTHALAIHSSTADVVMGNAGVQAFFPALAGRGLFIQRDGVAGAHLFSASQTSTFIGVQTDGTLSSPSATISGRGFNIAASAYDGTNYFVNVRVRMQCAQNQTASARGSVFAVDTVLNGATALAERLAVSERGSIELGVKAAVSTSATDGFVYVPTCAGTPTGAPTAKTGLAAMVIDTINNKFYFYSGGAWRDAGP